MATLPRLDPKDIGRRLGKKSVSPTSPPPPRPKGWYPSYPVDRTIMQIPDVLAIKTEWDKKVRAVTQEKYRKDYFPAGGYVPRTSIPLGLNYEYNLTPEQLSQNKGVPSFMDSVHNYTSQWHARDAKVMSGEDYVNEFMTRNPETGEYRLKSKFLQGTSRLAPVRVTVQRHLPATFFHALHEITLPNHPAAAVLPHELGHYQFYEKHPKLYNFLLAFWRHRGIASSYFRDRREYIKNMANNDYKNKTNSFPAFAIADIATQVPTVINELVADYYAKKLIDKYNTLKYRGYKQIPSKSFKALLLGSTSSYVTAPNERLIKDYWKYLTYKNHLRSLSEEVKMSQPSSGRSWLDRLFKGSR